MRCDDKPCLCTLTRYVRPEANGSVQRARLVLRYGGSGEKMEQVCAGEDTGRRLVHTCISWYPSGLDQETCLHSYPATYQLSTVVNICAHAMVSCEEDDRHSLQVGLNPWPQPCQSCPWRGGSTTRAERHVPTL